MDLKKLLDNYHLNAREESFSSEKSVQNREIDVLVPGIEISNDYGSFFMIENKYPLSYLYGGVQPGDLLDIDGPSFVCLSGNGSLDAKKLIFLDTETTGLSSGTGTVAFLTGIGFLEEDCFTVQQYFMRDYHEEAAMLYALRPVLENAQGVVTYNGKSFDMPLLSTRFIANRLRSKTSSLEHLDLLHISRLFWKGTYENCRLGTIEEKVLGETRIDDIPGERIPLEYFRYLDTRDATVMKQVLGHNLSDILSLSALLVRFSQMVESRNITEKTNELHGLSKLYEKRDDYTAVVECLERRIELNPDDCDPDVLRRISLFYKRTDQYEKAVELWSYYYSKTEAVPVTLGIKVFTGVELAKYYEHKKKDYHTALSMVNNLINYVRTKSFLGRAYMPDLEKRRKRLERLAKKP